MCRLRISKSQTLEERHDDLIVFSSNVCPSNGFVLTLISMDPCSQIYIFFLFLGQSLYNINLYYRLHKKFIKKIIVLQFSMHCSGWNPSSHFALITSLWKNCQSIFSDKFLVNWFLCSKNSRNLFLLHVVLSQGKNCCVNSIWIYYNACTIF